MRGILIPNLAFYPLKALLFTLILFEIIYQAIPFERILQFTLNRVKFNYEPAAQSEPSAMG